MNRAQILAELREVLSDDVRPYKWTDTRLLLFLSLGQDKFCEETGFFRGTPVTIATGAGVADYDIPPRTIEVLEVALDGVPLQKVKGTPPPAGEGAPFAWQTDKVTGLITLYPTPDRIYTLTLRTWRKSAIAFSVSGDPAIPEDLQLAMVAWAAHLAMSDRDSEKFDPKKAGEHEERFRAYVRQGKQAFRRLCTGSATTNPNPLYLV